MVADLRRQRPGQRPVHQFVPEQGRAVREIAAHVAHDEAVPGLADLHGMEVMGEGRQRRFKDAFAIQPGPAHGLRDHHVAGPHAFPFRPVDAFSECQPFVGQGRRQPLKRRRIHARLLAPCARSRPPAVPRP